MLNLNPPGVEPRYTLPADWEQRILSFSPSGVIAPLIRSVQSLVAKHGKASIAVEHVQELALLVCGARTQPRFSAYETLFHVLASAAGSTWPITVPLDEQPLEAKP